MIGRSEYRVVLLLWCFLLVCQLCVGQSKIEVGTAKKLFEGSWLNKNIKRHLTISFDDQDYVTINDWQGKWNQENTSIDAYKAYIVKDKLVMPADNTDLRSPYCEIVRQGDKLLYRCRAMDTKDKRFIEQILFVREKR